MTEPNFINWLFSRTHPFTFQSAWNADHASLVCSIFFWSFFYISVRFYLPAFFVWLAYIVRPRAFAPPPPQLYATSEPFVSVLIAGRNAGKGVAQAIQSVLSSDYRNVEVIFADDFSTDNSVAIARAFERTGRVRVFANANHSGKAANLNFALMFARGTFLFVLDADSQIYPDTIHRMLPYFEDPKVAAVLPSIHVRNSTASLLSRFQEIEYMLTYTLTQIWRSHTGLIAILPGMGVMFRTSDIKRLGGYDMGLGDDTDITLRLRKIRRELRFSLQARISTDVPTTLGHLLRQRARWTRNMVKVRLRKQRDMGSFRYGFKNALVFYENILNRTIHPLLVASLIIFSHLRSMETPLFLSSLYFYTVAGLYMKILIARDLTGAPSLAQCLLVPLYVLYRLPIFLTQVLQIIRELLHIKLWHPYVPRRIWDQIPHH